MHPGDTPEPPGSPSLFDSSLELHGWYPLTHPVDTRDVPTLSSPLLQLSVCLACMSDMHVFLFLVVSDESEEDVGFLTALLGPPFIRTGTAQGAVVGVAFFRYHGRSGKSQIGSPNPVPRWRLAWEGPFLSDILPSDVAGFGHGCVFRSTTHRSSDYAQPCGKYGLPLHHPRFLEWISALESARLLDQSPSAWLHSLSGCVPHDN